MKMKTNFHPIIHNSGRLNADIYRMIEVHNSGRTTINLAVIEAHVKTLNIVGMGLVDYDCKIEGDAIHIFESGQPTLTIEEHLLIGSVPDVPFPEINSHE